VPLRNASFDHWSARLQASSGGSVRKTFKALNQGIAVQLQQVMADRDRLFKRIHTNRSQYRVLGIKRTAEAAGLNEEIIDDSDFYQQLLADVIEAKAASAGAACGEGGVRRTPVQSVLMLAQRTWLLRDRTDGDDNDPAVMARQWLAVRQYHQKVKNRVDTKASKGRKIRYASQRCDGGAGCRMANLISLLGLPLWRHAGTIRTPSWSTLWCPSRRSSGPTPCGRSCSPASLVSGRWPPPLSRWTCELRRLLHTPCTASLHAYVNSTTSSSGS